LKTLAILVVLALGGCSLGKASPPVHYYALTPLAEAASGEPAAEANVGVGPVFVPRYLDRSGIVTREGNAELRVNALNRWAEPLDDMLAATIAENLVRILRSDGVVAYPWPPDAKIDQRVYVRIVRFEIGADNEAHLVCQWQVSTDANDGPLVRTELVSKPSGSGVDRQVMALSDTVAQLSGAIAAVLARDTTAAR
jgi:uncharacterized lipoprotein YmbA